MKQVTNFVLTRLFYSRTRRKLFLLLEHSVTIRWVQGAESYYTGIIGHSSPAFDMAECMSSGRYIFYGPISLSKACVRGESWLHNALPRIWRPGKAASAEKLWTGSSTPHKSCKYFDRRLAKLSSNTNYFSGLPEQHLNCITFNTNEKKL